MKLTGIATATLALVSAAHADTQLDDQVTWASSALRIELPADVNLERPQLGDESPEELVVQSRIVSIRISPDTIGYERTRVLRYDSIEAVRDYGDMYIGFNAAMDTVVVDYSFVIDSAGILHAVDPSTVQIVQTDTDKIFSDSKSVVIPLTGLDLGAMAVIKDTVTRHRGKDFGPWSAAFYEQYGIVQENLVIEISWSEPALRPDWKTELEGMTCAESANSVSCTARGVPAYRTGEDAYYDDIVPHFWVTESESWDDIRDWYRPLFYSALSADNDVTEMAQKLSAGLDDETEVLRAVHEFVAGDIRYVGLEHGESAYVPKPSAVTLRRRYGDCKDKAALLVDLLLQLGIEMSPVLVSTERKDLSKVALPSRHLFDHLIVCGELASGREYCLDPTDPYTGIDHVSSWIQGAVAMRVDDTAIPMELPAQTYSWTVRELVDMHITPSGALSETGRVEYDGAYGASIRSSVAGLTTEELEEWALDDYHSAVSKLVDPKFKVSGIENARGPIIVEWETRYPDIIAIHENLRYSETAAWLQQTIGFLTSENEHYDYRFRGLDFESTINFSVDNNWRLLFPGPDIEFKHRFGELERTYVMSGQSVRIVTRLRAPSAVVGVEDIPEFNDFTSLVIDESILRINGNVSD